jgi:RNA ligase (TIGR02306 family)
MSTFSVELVNLDEVSAHPNADLLELARVGGYRAVVGKGIHKTGDLVLYIPEEALLPVELAAEFGYEGKLAGPLKNRVKAIRLRGELSQGLVVPYHVAMQALEKRGFGGLENCKVGSGIGHLLGIEKYEQPIPANMAGRARPRPSWFPTYTNIENIKKEPDTFTLGENVVMTEKIHGTNFGVGMTKDDREMLVSSRRMILEREDTNLYWRAAIQYDLEAFLNYLLDLTGFDVVILWGEIYGAGIQNLTYGGENGKLNYRAFDIYYSDSVEDEEGFLSIAGMREVCFDKNIDTVPILWAGPFSFEKLNEYTNGTTTVGGSHTREGVVVKPQIERRNRNGRCIAKSIAEAYLLDKNRTDLQ